VAAAAILLTIVFAAPLPAQTLHSLVVQSDSPPNAASLPNLHRNVVGYSVLDTADWFVAAYYLEDATPGLEPPLFVDRYDRKAGQWRSAAFTDEQLRNAHTDCLGSVLELRAALDSFLLSTHLNPSAQCLLVLSTTLDIRTTLYGWPLATLKDGSIVFHRSMRHFSPVHPAEIGFYNRKTGRSYTLYPSKPYQSVRQSEIAMLQAFFDANDAWCQLNNHPCDPERFDNSLDGEVVVNEQADALAFAVTYNAGTKDGRIPPITGSAKKVAYVFRWVSNEYAFQYREMLYEHMVARTGAANLAQLVTPERIKQIFGK
jgi:hypothetical protein